VNLLGRLWEPFAAILNEDVSGEYISHSLYHHLLTFGLQNLSLLSFRFLPCSSSSVRRLKYLATSRC
jgi:hypothetical protein